MTLLLQVINNKYTFKIKPAEKYPTHKSLLMMSEVLNQVLEKLMHLNKFVCNIGLRLSLGLDCKIWKKKGSLKQVG